MDCGAAAQGAPCTCHCCCFCCCHRRRDAVVFGWLTLCHSSDGCSRQGRKRNTSATGVTVAGVASAAAQAQAAAKQPAPFGDFYRFQKRENRRNGEAPAPVETTSAVRLVALLPAGQHHVTSLHWLAGALPSACLIFLLSVAELLDLRLKFEQDKKKLAELKAARRFKPY